LSFTFISTAGFCGEKIYTMKGTITAIEMRSKTVVVEVPLGKKDVHCWWAPCAGCRDQEREKSS
jgi:hypothetical protein